MPVADCVRCGNCCDGDGWVIFSIEEHRRLSAADQAHLKRVDDGPAPYYVTEYGQCPWFDRGERVCTIHAIKPRTCVEFDAGSPVARERGCRA